MTVKIVEATYQSHSKFKQANGGTPYVQLRFKTSKGKRATVYIGLTRQSIYYLKQTIDVIRDRAGKPPFETTQDKEYTTLNHQLAGCKRTVVHLEEECSYAPQYQKYLYHWRVAA